MTESDFEALNEHLRELEPIFDRFCAQHDFQNVPRRAIGRYPRVRIERIGSTKIWFDLWMELDDRGQRFERFRRDLPYELSAGACVVVQDGSMHGIRFQKCIQCFSGKPFEQVAPVLEREMERHLPTIEQWDFQYLLKNGEKVCLGK